MPNLNQLPIFIVVFFVAMGIMGILPGLIGRYRDHFRVNLAKTGRELSRFFIDIKPSRIILIASAVGGVVGFITGSWVFAGALAALGLFAPRLTLAIWKDVRSSQFDAQLMDALILLGNALKSGLDIMAGIELISTNMKGVISEEFGLVLNSYRLGASLETSLIDLTTRIKSRSLETVIYSIIIQRESGGNIVKTFDQLIQTIREEAKLQKKVKALTAQGRTQIIFLAGFPWALAAMFFFMAPDFMLPAIRNPWGQLAVVFLLVWEAIGILVTKKIVTVDV